LVQQSSCGVINVPRVPLERQRYLEVVAEARASLDAEAFEEAWKMAARCRLRKVSRIRWQATTWIRE
jgi:hypothetical protein